MQLKPSITHGPEKHLEKQHVCEPIHRTTEHAILLGVGPFFGQMPTGSKPIRETLELDLAHLEH